MSLWLVRAGKMGEHEDRFLGGDHIYLTWGAELDGTDLSAARDYEGIREIVRGLFPEDPAGRVGNWSGQIWVFAVGMKPGDWFVMPLKQRPAIAVGEITGPYRYDPAAGADSRHSRTVRWIAKGVPRSAFEQDLLYSFGAFMTFCQIQRNDAERRVRAMAAAGWKTTPPPAVVSAEAAHEAEPTAVDLEVLARDPIASLVIRRLKGHGLARLVEAVLKAQGYSTYRSPEGADKGVDILAAPGSLGFGSPRLCVQVKSGDDPVGSSTLNELIGSMQNVQAEQGLLVAWGGFKSSVLREIPAQFFRVRLWGQSELLGELLATYDRLDADLRADLPLKRIWTVTHDEDSEA